MALDFNLANGQNRQSILGSVLEGRQRMRTNQARDLLQQAAQNPEQRGQLLSQALALAPRAAATAQGFYQNQAEQEHDIHLRRLRKFHALLEGFGRTSSVANTKGDAGIGMMDAYFQQVRPDMVELVGELGGDPSKIPLHYDKRMLPFIKAGLAKTSVAFQNQMQNVPAGIQEADYWRRLYRNGTPQEKKMAAYQLGIAARPSSVPFGFKTVEGPQGQPKLVRTNRATGGIGGTGIVGQTTYGKNLSATLGTRNAEIATNPTLNKQAATAAARKARKLGEVERSLEAPAARSRMMIAINQNNRIINLLKRLRSSPGLGWVAKNFESTLGANIPTSDARRAVATYNQFRGLAQFRFINEMRKGSKTGGFVGQISDREEKAIRAASTGVQAGLGMAATKQRISDAIKQLQSQNGYMRSAFQSTFGSGKQPNQSRTPNQSQPTQSGAMDAATAAKVRGLLNGQ